MSKASRRTAKPSANWWRSTNSLPRRNCPTMVRGRARCRLDDAGDRGLGGGEIACHRGDPAHTVKEHPTNRQLVIGAPYLAEARLRLVVGLFGKASKPEDPSQQGPGHRAVVRMPPDRQPVLVLEKRRILDDALKVALRFRQPASPEQYHTHTPIGEHDACRVADLLGYCPGTLGRCRRPRVFATKANYAREI